MEKFIRLHETGMDIHHMPFDEVEGLHKTREELLQEGYLVESIPEPLQIEGKAPVMKFNKATNTVYYDYVDYTPPKTPEQELEELKAKYENMAQALDALLMGV